MQRSTSQAASTAPSSAAASSAPSSASGGPSPSDIREGDQAEELEQQQQSGLVTGLQGVLFTVSKEKDVSYGLAVFKLFADFLQLFLLMVTPKYGFDIKSNSKGWQIASVIGLNDFFAARGLTFFLAFLYVFVILLVGVVAMSIWVAWSFRSNRFDQVWPIVLLRWFSNIFFQVLDVASLSLFLITLNCQYFDVPPERQYHSVEFGVACFQLPHLIHAVVAVTSLVLFIAMATMVQLGEMDL
ncbi:PAS domain-containing protein [Haematococcus lacustris]|uniref:PAS domain-containing protein n=1 Tax=Haematococcus lacustris TaxID=44745 RepID=A0A699ZLN1_HAELA|nr:PAS domain-containing protein [Haematococcus lacustris]